MRIHHRYKHAEDKDDQVLALNNYAEGFLVKQGARVKNWKRRYFVFRDGYLSYRKDQRETSKLSSGRSLYVSPASEQQACIWYEVVQGYVMRQQMTRQLQHVSRQRQKHLEPIWETESAAEQSAELSQYNLLR
ncbi:hypothetical protein PI124_g14857 [Phytophthora idaei]|nr:hypothetical protein PI125_g14628 [Phytophthora idaei]KAG3145209.1 hypothetical protein PI126_g13825 [Phytophthora idaei]KAG3240245.1 hypothetical protein PI124_g14857 [Phytophthora idaei]